MGNEGSKRNELTGSEPFENILGHKLQELGEELNGVSEKLLFLDANLSKLSLENNSLKDQVVFLSQKVVRLEKHDIHFINCMKDAITLELHERIRVLEHQVKIVKDHDPCEETSDDSIEIIEVFANERKGDDTTAEEPSGISYITDRTASNSRERGKKARVDCVNDNSELMKDNTDEVELVIRELLERRKVKESADLDIYDVDYPTLRTAALEVKNDDEKFSRLKLELRLMKLSSRLSALDLRDHSCPQDFMKLLEEFLGFGNLTKIMVLKQPDIIFSLLRMQQWIKSKEWADDVDLVNTINTACLKVLSLFPKYKKADEDEFLNYLQEQLDALRDKSITSSIIEAVCLT